MRLALPLLAVFALALAGCRTSEQPPNMGGTPREKPVASIISLSPSASEIIGQGAAFRLIKGRTAACNWPGLLTATNVPIVAEVKPNFELIAMSKPDLIVYDADLYSAADIEKIKQIGAPTYEFKARTIDDFIKEVFGLAKVIGYETSLSSYVDKVVAARGEYSGDTLDPKPRVAFILPSTQGDPLIAGKGSFQADVVRSVGGDAVGPDGEKFVPISAEQLIALDPDIIISAGDPTSMLNDPRFKTMRAIREKRIVAINQDVAVRRGFRVHNLIETVAKGIRAPR